MHTYHLVLLQMLSNMQLWVSLHSSFVAVQGLMVVVLGSIGCDYQQLVDRAMLMDPLKILVSGTLLWPFLHRGLQLFVHLLLRLFCHYAQL